MAEKYLTLEQNACAARIFLNTFGLTLENINTINEFSKIKIFDKALNEVGKLHFNDGKVIMNATYNNSILEARYDIVKILGLIDVEDDEALFGTWCTIITFKLQNSNTISLNGNFFIESSIDSKFGISCNCHVLINCEIPSKCNITLKILKDGRTFGLKNVSGDYIEKIDIMPWDDLNGFICHDITNGKYDKKNHVYPYRKYAGVLNGGDDKLHVFLTENK